MLIKFVSLFLAFIFLTQVAQASIWDDITNGWDSGTKEAKCFFGDEESCPETEKPDEPTRTRGPPADVPAKPTKSSGPPPNDEENREPTRPPPPTSRPTEPAPRPTTPAAKTATPKPEPTSDDEPPRVTSSEEDERPSATPRISTLTESRSTQETLSTTISVTAGGVSSTGDPNPGETPPAETGVKPGAVAAGVVVGVLAVGGMLIGAWFVVRKRNLAREAAIAQQRAEQASFGRVEKV